MGRSERARHFLVWARDAVQWLADIWGSRTETTHPQHPSHAQPLGRSPQTRHTGPEPSARRALSGPCLRLTPCQDACSLKHPHSVNYLPLSSFPTYEHSGCVEDTHIYDGTSPCLLLLISQVVSRSLQLLRKVATHISVSLLYVRIIFFQ